MFPLGFSGPCLAHAGSVHGSVDIEMNSGYGSITSRIQVVAHWSYSPFYMQSHIVVYAKDRNGVCEGRPMLFYSGYTNRGIKHMKRKLSNVLGYVNNDDDLINYCMQKIRESKDRYFVELPQPVHKSDWRD